MDGSPYPGFISEDSLKPILYPVEFVDALFHVYKQNKGGKQKTLSILSAEEFMNRSKEKAIDLGMGDTCYPNFVLFTMDEFERNLYLYYLNGLKPSPRIEMNFKSRSADPEQVNDFLYKVLAAIV